MGVNALVWFVWNREITDPRRNAGDLLRIGYILGHVAPHQGVDDLPRRHIRGSEYNQQPVDMVTVGDSFSIGGGGGRNSHYQDYIASLQGLTVLNVPGDVISGTEASFFPIGTVSKLINSGYLDLIQPKYLLLESVERFAIQRLTREFSLQETATIEELDRIFHGQRTDGKKSIEKESTAKQNTDNKLELHFINNGNMEVYWKQSSVSV